MSPAVPYVDREGGTHWAAGTATMARRHIARNRALASRRAKCPVEMTGDFYSLISVRFKGTNLAFITVYFEDGIGPTGFDVPLVEILVRVRRTWISDVFATLLLDWALLRAFGYW